MWDTLFHVTTSVNRMQDPAFMTKDISSLEGMHVRMTGTVAVKDMIRAKATSARNSEVGR
jgi:hypothetical protein